MDVIRFIKEIGFPAAAFVMLYVFMRTTLAENTRALQELAQTIRELKGSLLRLNGKPQSGSGVLPHSTGVAEWRSSEVAE